MPGSFEAVPAHQELVAKLRDLASSWRNRETAIADPTDPEKQIADARAVAYEHAATLAERLLAPADEGIILTCRGCGATATLPYVDSRHSVVRVDAAVGWGITDDGPRCLSCLFEP